MVLSVFHTLIAAHIATGVTGALTFWIAVLSRKGSPRHKRWGRVFTRCLLATGFIAGAMGTISVFDPMGAHPTLVGKFEPAVVQGIFGWMMIYLAVLTVNLTWYGWLCIENRRNHAGNLETRNLVLQYALLAAALNCAVRGWEIGQPLMILISLVGFATAITNLLFMYNKTPGPQDWLKEHIKALVGAGISVYTAFFTFGSVRIFPAIALNPALWAVPLTVGLGLIFYHRHRVSLVSP